MGGGGRKGRGVLLWKTTGDGTRGWKVTGNGERRGLGRNLDTAVQLDARQLMIRHGRPKRG